MAIIAQLARPSLGVVQEVNAAASNFPRSTITQGTVTSSGSQYLTLPAGMWEIVAEFENTAAELRMFYVPVGSTFTEVARSSGVVRKMVTANAGDRVYIGIYNATVTPGQKLRWALTPLSAPA